MFTYGSIRSVEIATTDVDPVVAFFARLGFQPVETPTVNQQLTLTVGAGADIVLTRCGVSRSHRTGRELGPRALDFYCHDLDAGLAAFDGWPASPQALLSLGPVTMRQVMIHGPDGVDVVLVESSHRRPSLLDTDPTRLFSELHSVVWCVPDRSTEAAYWSDHGATRGMDLRFADPSLSAYLGLPADDTVVEMVMLSDSAVAPTILELMSFPDAGLTVGEATHLLNASSRGASSEAGAAESDLSGVRSITVVSTATPGRRLTPGGIDITVVSP